jgi:heavy metal translocating P-type ATPase
VKSTVGSRLGSLGRTARSFPIPFLAASGLVVGALLTYLLGRPDLGRWVWLGVLVVGGVPLVYHTVRRMIRGEFASDIIAALAIVGALGLDQAFAGVIIVLMQSGGEALDAFAFHRASSSLRALLDRAPRRAYRHTDTGLLEIDVAEVRPGDRLLVRPGDVVPVDGTVLGKGALLDESAVTGEPLPRRREEGSSVPSGVVNVGAAFDLRAERPAAESQYARIVDLVRNAQERKPRIQRLADRYAVVFTPVVLAVALFGYLFTHAPQTALAVLVVATPCPLIIATPIAVVGAVNRAADRGLIVKSGGAIEEIGTARVVVFDKTGTITVGQPEVETVVPVGPGSGAEELLARAASLEQLSSHPLAGALVREAHRRGIVLRSPTAMTEHPGAGVEGILDGRTILVGSRSLAERRFPGSTAAAESELRRTAELRGRLAAYVVVDGRAAGAILFTDRLREGVPEMVRRLRALGVEHVAMLTGDARANAEEIARQGGIPEVFAELSPEGKVERVRAFRHERGSTVMVGDGINDAAALASASVGVALGARGAGISTEAADVVLLVDDVTRVADAVGLGQRMLRIARQGIWVGLGASAVLMVLAALGGIVPALGAVLQEVIDVAVILNALRVR